MQIPFLASGRRELAPACFRNRMLIIVVLFFSVFCLQRVHKRAVYTPGKGEAMTTIQITARNLSKRKEEYFRSKQQI